MGDILGLESIFPEAVLALGLAMVLGNGFAIWKNSRGEAPKGVRGEFRPGRAWFLGIVGVLMAIWGVASILT